MRQMSKYRSKTPNQQHMARSLDALKMLYGQNTQLERQGLIDPSASGSESRKPNGGLPIAEFGHCDVIPGIES